jgi:hypothetical protein
MSDEQWIPGSKVELMSEIKREWKLLMDVVAKLEAAKKLNVPDEGGWTAKDNLAHLAEWMNSLMGYHMDKGPAEEVMHLTKEQTEGWDMEIINPVLFERNKNRSIEEVMEHLKQTYEKLLAKLDATPFEELLKPRYPEEDPEKRPLLLWVLGDTSEHFAEHREVIERML